MQLIINKKRSALINISACDYLPDTIPLELMALYKVVLLKSGKNIISIAIGPSYPLKKLENLRFTLGENIKVIEKDDGLSRVN